MSDRSLWHAVDEWANQPEPPECPACNGVGYVEIGPMNLNCAQCGGTGIDAEAVAAASAQAVAEDRAYGDAVAAELEETQRLLAEAPLELRRTADHDPQCPTCGGTGYVPTGRDRWPYHCLGDIPAAPTPTPERVRAYMADRRFLRAHAAETDTYWKRVRAAQLRINTLEDAQRGRFSQVRARQLDTARASISNARLDAVATIAGAYSLASERCQAFRQDFYGAWHGIHSRRAWAGNYHLSYGRIVPWNERAGIGA